MTTRGVDPPDGARKPQVSPAPPPTRDERWSALRIELQDANARIAPLESELAALRQIVADVETCRAIEGDSVTVLCDNPEAESVGTQAAVELCGASTGWEPKRFYAPTWQAALHAAAEHVRNTNPERTGHEV